MIRTQNLKKNPHLFWRYLDFFQFFCLFIKPELYSHKCFVVISIYHLHFVLWVFQAKTWFGQIMELHNFALHPLHRQILKKYFKINLVKLKFMFSKKATKIDKIFTISLTLCSKCQIDGEDFVNFCGLLRKHELYLGVI